MTATDLRALLAAAGLPVFTWQFPDAAYETVSAGWMDDNWQAWLDARPAELCVMGDAGGKRVRVRPLWLADAGDCDNLALGLMAHADVGNALASIRTGKTRGGLAMGVIFYVCTQIPAGSHAINWFVDHDGGVNFFEPATGSLLNLSTTERSSAWFGLAT